MADCPCSAHRWQTPVDPGARRIVDPSFEVRLAGPMGTDRWSVPVSLDPGSDERVKRVIPRRSFAASRDLSLVTAIKDARRKGARFHCPARRTLRSSNNVLTAR